MRAKFIAGSWKTHTTSADAARPAKADDGSVIGGASLDAGQFLAIVQAGISEGQSEGKSA